MRHRGRKSNDETIAALQLIRLSPADRQPPPGGLSAAEAAEWTAIVNRMPGGWFGRETQALLTAFCRHVAEAEKLSGQLAVLDAALAVEADEGRPEVELVCSSAAMRERLLRMRAREVAAASSLATRMRITQQSAYDKTKAGSVQRHDGPVPWEYP